MQDIENEFNEIDDILKEVEELGSQSEYYHDER